MGEGTDWVTQYHHDPEDDADERWRPPIWVVVVVGVSVVVGGWLLTTQRSTDGDSVAATTIPFEPYLTTSTTSSTATPATAEPVFVLGDQPAAEVTAESPGHLRGYVAVTSPNKSLSHDTVWVFRPGGSVVSSGGNVIPMVDVESYPMLITAGRLILGGRLFDLDLAEPPMTLWAPGSALLGSGRPGVAWLWLRSNSSGYFLTVAPVDVESGTVGEQVSYVDLFDDPVVGVADGLIVVDLEGEFAFWSPTDGLVSLDLPGVVDAVVAASGNLAVVVSSGNVSVLDIVSGEFVSSFELPHVARPVTSACLSPDGQHVIVVGSNGEAVVGNITTGDLIDLNAVNDEFPIQKERGIGWTTDDQLVFIGSGELFSKNITGFDVATGESFAIAQLDRAEYWWLTASGTMC